MDVIKKNTLLKVENVFMKMYKQIFTYTEKQSIQKIMCT